MNDELGFDPLEPGQVRVGYRKRRGKEWDEAYIELRIYCDAMQAEAAIDLTMDSAKRLISALSALVD